MNFLNELAKHSFGDFEVGDDAVAHRANGPDIAVRASEHFPGLVADRDDALGVAVDFCLNF